MGETGTVTRALLTMTRGRDNGQTLARRICEACVAGLDIDGAAISVLTASVSRETLWATDATAQRLEDLQFGLNEGACMDAATSGNPVLVPDLNHSTETARWPVFAAAVAEQTLVRALFALPLTWGAINLGVLDLYRATPGGLSEEQGRDALAAADTAARMVLGQRTEPGDATDDLIDPTDFSAASTPGAGSDGPGHWLSPEVGHRAEIHQATGMVLTQLGITAPDALARLRGYAFVHQRLLLDIARNVVDRTLVFTDDMT